MKIFILGIILLFSYNNLSSQIIDKNTIVSLEYIQKGYIQYGVGELRKLSGLNDLPAQFYLAECLNNGYGIEKNEMEAFKLYRKTAERGLPDAMVRLKSFYENGIIVNKDNVKAQEWEKRFVKKGGEKLLPDFAQIINEGFNFPQNYALNPNENTGNIKTIAQDNSNVNNITVIQSQILTSNNLEEPILIDKITSDVDEINNITRDPNNNTFVLIIANENYHDVENVPHAIHDGEIFKDYCNKLLGIPKNNIHFIQDATLNNIRREINLISQIVEEFNGEANIILYYAGHGIPNEKTREPYIVPIDGYSSDITTCYPLRDLYSKLGQLPANKIIIFMDACFSGSLRGEGMLASARGISIKTNVQEPKGKMVVFSATQGDETAYPFEEEGHGMFTYYLLKHLKESEGDIILKELAEKIENDVRKQSLIVNGKRQTPTVQYSPQIQELWTDWKLNE